MRTFDFTTGKTTDDRPNIKFFDLVERHDDIAQRLSELEEQVTVLSYRCQ